MSLTRLPHRRYVTMTLSWGIRGSLLLTSMVSRRVRARRKLNRTRVSFNDVVGALMESRKERSALRGTLQTMPTTFQFKFGTIPSSLYVSVHQCSFSYVTCSLSSSPTLLIPLLPILHQLLHSSRWNRQYIFFNRSSTYSVQKNNFLNL